MHIFRNTIERQTEKEPKEERNGKSKNITNNQ
jgi:hypothetical protein